jgi:hypothetical protein
MMAFSKRIYTHIYIHYTYTYIYIYIYTHVSDQASSRFSPVSCRAEGEMGALEASLQEARDAKIT